MRRITTLLCVLILIFTVCGCGYLPLADDPTNDQNAAVVNPDLSMTESNDKNTFDYSSVQIKINIGYNEDTYEESGTIVAKDKDGNTIWTYNGGKYPCAQLESYSEIGKHGSNYYYSEGGTVVALDIETGKRVWENKDFGGYGTRYVFGEDAIYLCGYFGPDFFVVSYDGATLKRIETINNDYWSAYKMEEKDGKIAIYFDGSEDQNGGILYVDKKTYKISQ